MNVNIAELVKLTGKTRKTIDKKLADLDYSDPSKKTYSSDKALALIYGTKTSLKQLTKTQIQELTGLSYPTVRKRLEWAEVEPNTDGLYESKEALETIYAFDDGESVQYIINEDNKTLPERWDEDKHRVYDTIMELALENKDYRVLNKLTEYVMKPGVYKDDVTDQFAFKKLDKLSIRQAHLMKINKITDQDYVLMSDLNIDIHKREVDQMSVKEFSEYANNLEPTRLARVRIVEKQKEEEAKRRRRAKL